MTHEDFVIMNDQQYNDHVRHYLITRDWWEDKNGKWHDKTRTCLRICHIDVAYAVQIMRDQYKALPWYKKLWKKP